MSGGGSRRRRRSLLQLLLPFLDPAPQRAAPSSRRRQDRPPMAAPVASRATGRPRGEDGPDAALRARWQAWAPEWGRAWGVPDLAARVTLELSHRMRTSLGGFYPTDRRIRISDVLLEAPEQLLREILCHEAAHAAVQALHGDGVRSHGREWRALMRAVGLDPRVRVPGAEIGEAGRRAARKRWVWRHRCPVCRAERLAGRPVSQWRCRECHAAGRDGRLVITRLAVRTLPQSR